MSGVAIWHDLECGGYEADLTLWEELAERCGGKVLELGCGTGRVALHLARRGHRVVGLDRDPALTAELNARAEGLDCRAEVGDARDFELEQRDFDLVIAPMQLLQLLAGPAERTACLTAAAQHLRPGGMAAAAIVEDAIGGFNREAEVPPDTREIDGWVYASLPVEARVDPERITIRRLRKLISPEGELERGDDRVELIRVDSGRLEAEATRAGLAPAGRRVIPPTPAHVGSKVVLLESVR